MKVLWKLWILAVISAFATISATAQDATHSKSPSFCIQISVASAKVRVGTEVDVKILVKNISHDSILLSKSNGKGQAELSYYSVEVLDSENKPAPETRYYGLLKGTVKPENPGEGIVTRSDVGLELKPGEIMEDELSLTKLFSLGKPGSYTIHVERPDWNSEGVVKSNSIRLTVIP